MNKTLLIFRYEFLFTLKRTGFIIMTLIVPLLALLVIGVLQIVSAVSKPQIAEVKNIGFVDEIGGFDQFTAAGDIKLIPYDSRDSATSALVNKNIAEYFIISKDYINRGIIQRFTLEKQLETPVAISSAIKNFLTSNMLSGKVPEQTVTLVKLPLYLQITRLTGTGEVATEQGGYGNVIIPGIFSLLLALSLTFCSSYLLQGLGEEKESRLIEVLLSSVSTQELLAGKILGLGAAGLVQVVVWLVSAPLLVNLTSSTFGGFFSTVTIPPNFIVLGIVYFILGYMLFAVLSAGVGAISPNAREGQQMATMFTLGAISPLWFSSILFIFPNNPIWIVLTIFPVTAPVEVMLRLGVSDIPVWQLAVSILALLLSVFLAFWLAARLFRTYLLMYGKRPGLGQIIRSFRNG
jgi:ABC-2 type transport system permease protein